MKKILLFLLCFTLFVSPAWAMREIGGNEIKPGVSQLNIEAETAAYMSLPSPTLDIVTVNDRIRLIKYSTGVALASVTANLSTVNGTAFISNPSVDLRPYVGFKVSITAGGKTLIGWIKAAGTGETYGAELHTSANAASDPNGNEANAITGWVPYGNHAVTSSSADPSVGTYHFNVAETHVASQGAFFNLNLTSLGLYKLSGNGKNVSGSSAFRIGTSSFGSFLAGIGISSSSYVTKTLYATATQIAMSFGFSGVGPHETNVDNVSFKQVLTPSATGVTIVSAQGGSTFNFTSDDGINPNAASFVITVTVN